MEYCSKPQDVLNNISCRTMYSDTSANEFYSSFSVFHTVV